VDGLLGRSHSRYDRSLTVSASPRLATLVLAVVLAGSAGCTDLQSINETKQDQRRFAMSDGALVVDSAGADLRLVTGTSGTVLVERLLTGKATARGNASWSLAGRTLRLRVTCSGLVPDCGGRHIVHVPPGLPVRVSNDQPVRAVGVTGDLTAAVTDSWLRVEEPAGRLRLQATQTVTVTAATSTDVTASSDERPVTLAFRRPPDRVEARATAGAVTITLPKGTETYRVTCRPGPARPGSATLRSDPASKRTVVAIAAPARSAQVRKAA
jgi:hypothetical protein